MIDWAGALSSVAGGGGGGMYGNSGQSGVSTPINTGGIGAQSFIFGGNPNVQTALTSPWLIFGAVALVAVLLWRRK